MGFGFILAFSIPLSHLFLALDDLTLSDNSHSCLPVQKATAGNQDVEKDENSLKGEFFMQSTLSLGILLQPDSNCSSRLWFSLDLILYYGYRLNAMPRTPEITQMKIFTRENYPCSQIHPLW